MPNFPLKPRLDVAINYLCHDRLCSAVHHYSAPGIVPTPAQIQTAADGLSTRFAGPMKDFLSLGNEYLGVEVRYVSADFSRYATSENGKGVGTSGSAATPTDDLRLPTADMVVIQKIGDGPAKRANGSIFLSGINEADTDGNRLNLAGREKAESVGGAFLTANTFPGLEGTPCVLSRTANLMYSIFQIRVTRVLGHIRRRRPVR